MFKKIYKNMRFVSLFTLIISAVLVFSTGYYIFNLRIEAEIREQALLLSQFVNHCLEKNGALPDDMPHFTDGKSFSDPIAGRHGFIRCRPKRRYHKGV